MQREKTPELTPELTPEITPELTPELTHSDGDLGLDFGPGAGCMASVQALTRAP